MDWEKLRKQALEDYKEGRLSLLAFVAVYYLLDYLERSAPAGCRPKMAI